MADHGWESAAQAAFGGLQFEMLDSRQTERRSIRTVTYDGVDGGQRQDHGAELRDCTCRIKFFSLDQVREYQEFRALLDGQPRLFVHPLLGVYEAILESINTVVQADATAIECTATFLEAGFNDGELVITEPTDVSTGANAIDALATATAVAFEPLLGLPSVAALNTTLPTMADTARAWDGKTRSEVLAEQQPLLTEIGIALRALEQRTDPAAAAAHVLLLRLRLALVETGATVAPAPQTRRILVAQPVPALMLAMQRGQHEAYADAALELNPLESPLALDGELEVPA